MPRDYRMALTYFSKKVVIILYWLRVTLQTEKEAILIVLVNLHLIKILDIVDEHLIMDLLVDVKNYTKIN